jgi:hypothetical protein
LIVGHNCTEARSAPRARPARVHVRALIRCGFFPDPAVPVQIAKAAAITPVAASVTGSPQSAWRATATASIARVRAEGAPIMRPAASIT